MKNVLITGVTGQDGAYLAKLLLEKNYKVYGLYRRLSTPNFWRLQSLGIYDKINLISGDLSDLSSILNAFKASNPDEVYHYVCRVKQVISQGTVNYACCLDTTACRNQFKKHPCLLVLWNTGTVLQVPL